MLLNAAQRSLATRQARGASRRARGLVAVRVYETESVPQETPGAKVEKWLKTPFDVLSFGPRAGLGALLSMPEKLQSLQSDVNRAVELLQDPRPLDEKSAIVLREVEDTVVEFLEKGANVESDVLANVKTVLPSDLANIISEYIPDPPNKTSPATVEPSPYDAPQAPVVTYYQADVQDNQIASEMSEISAAVLTLRDTLDSVRTNTDVAATNMLRLKLREARDLLARRLAEISPATANDPSIAAATREARILLEEVDAQFF